MRFHRTTWHGPVPVIRRVEKYTEAELGQFAAQFKPDGHRCRRRSRIAGLMIAVGTLCLLLAPLLVAESRQGLLATLVFCWGGVVLLSVTAPPLTCPACSNLLDGEPGQYCPECGRLSLREGNWLRPTSCQACGKVVRAGRRRGHLIRACSHCGIPLDEKGV